MELLSSLAPGRLNPGVAARIVAETAGNPLALAEVALELSTAQLAGAQVLPEPLPIGGSLEKAFGCRVRRLPPEARLLLAVAAAERAGPAGLLWRAAGQLGIDPDAAADLGGLADIGPKVAFRHPLIRSAAYHAIPLSQRRLIHQALAAAGDGSERPDRVAWHLGMATRGPDEAVAARLEQAAGRARDRGGYAAAVAFLSRAAELSAGEGQRGRRLFEAAEAALTAGQPVRPARCWRRRRRSSATRWPARRPGGCRARSALPSGRRARRHRSCWRRRGRSRRPTCAVPARRCSRRSTRRCSPAGPQAARSCWR